ncbi:apoptosis-inducing factor 3-like [Tiliqua scincoides]|uniref:apoptosis-inducing factor 3-like n=1 Tax=Tiliqua scincoides TaxID=71010 RepID=UPI003462339A
MEGVTVMQKVCREEEMCNGEMREVEVGGYTVLLVKEHQQFTAMGSRCPHAGAPLFEGVFAEGRVRCPWHGSCYSTKTGDIEEYPTLDCLPTFKVTVDNGNVFITAKMKDLESSRRVMPMSRGSQDNHRTVLLLGAGPASLTCAETLRQENFTGRIIMVTWEDNLPYDKTQLSKNMEVKAESIYLRPQSFLDAYNIEVWMQKEVVSVDVSGKKAQFSDGTSQAYDDLLIATGARPRRLQIPGSNLQNVCVLLIPADANKIARLATGNRLVIVGASFIGMEVAAYLAEKAASIHVIERQAFPYQEALGDKVGGVAMKMLQAQGVEFHMKTEVKELQGENGKVTQVVLSSGDKIPADVVVVGIGVIPNSSFLQGSPIALDEKGAILVDLFMRTNVPSIFAAGDVVSFPVALLGGKHHQICHWQIAQKHGHVAALNILQKEVKLHTVPYFWTRLKTKSIRYAGCGVGYTDTVLKGDLNQEKFVIFYLKDGYVIAVASLNFDPIVSLVAEVIYSGSRISKQEAE